MAGGYNDSIIRITIKTSHLFTAEGTVDELLLVDGRIDGVCQDHNMNNTSTCEDK